MSIYFSYLKDLLSCYEKYVRRLCGDTAAIYETEFNVRYFGPVGDIINCPLVAGDIGQDDHKSTTTTPYGESVSAINYVFKNV